MRRVRPRRRRDAPGSTTTSRPQSTRGAPSSTGVCRRSRGRPAPRWTPPHEQRGAVMNESYVTVQGWVGNEVDLRDVGDTQVASFRVGSTPRYNKGGAWVDGQTSWYTVNC